MSKDLVCNKEEIKCNNIVKQYKNVKLWLWYKMRPWDHKTIKEHNPNWPEILDHPYRILIIGSSGSRKTNALQNLINHEPGIDKMYLFAKDPYEAKFWLINLLENAGLKYLINSKFFYWILR